MAERKGGLYALLASPLIYEMLQRAMGLAGVRREFLGNFLRARRGDRVLDIGCGVATLLDHLPEVGYVGFEPNPAYVEAARRKYGDRGTFHVGRFDKQAASRLQPFDIAMAVAVLHHMSDTEALELFGLLATVLKPGGRVVTLDNVFVEGQNPLARLLISFDRGQNVRSPDGYAALVGDAFSHVAGAIFHKGFPPYTYWMMTASDPRSI
jgi:SAM-dependent methyltransferase